MSSEHSFYGRLYCVPGVQQYPKPKILQNLYCTGVFRLVVQNFFAHAGGIC